MEKLAEDIQAEFPGIAGFSKRNMYYMRDFYLLYRQDEKVQPLVAQIGWSHNLVITEQGRRLAELQPLVREIGWSHQVIT